MGLAVWRAHMTHPPSAAARADILIAEDDPIVAKLLNHTLSRRGFTVHYASDGQQAAELIRSMAPPRLVLLDVMLPHYNGFELIAQIRAIPAWRAVPIIVLTSMSQEGSVVRALEAGANDYIVKPFRPDELVARVRRFTTVAVA
jgi:DNA-binding response OmpR family regulator